MEGRPNNKDRITKLKTFLKKLQRSWEKYQVEYSIT